MRSSELFSAMRYTKQSDTKYCYSMKFEETEIVKTIDLTPLTVKCTMALYTDMEEKNDNLVTFSPDEIKAIYLYYKEQGYFEGKE